MIETDLYQLKFPIGEFTAPDVYTEELLDEWIETLAGFPLEVFQMCSKLSAEEKNWIYRPGGWSIKQVIHHCADSHMNAFIRIKLSLTEDCPTITPYQEAKWAELEDSLDDNIRDSINIISGTHKKWARLITSLSPEQLKRQYIHPEHQTRISIIEAIGTYAWHCKHHLGHIQLAIVSNGRNNTSNN